ncbi:hypothetical protein EYC80_007631 [Monilinia laxa]|uniref:Uncharacterized protein n=1 Tax=Monilinia laxa TaxID=61186 RepID=A0A5N6JWH6_MONLA|nr:hypothetical protein EYC80_007631 [Monilinia laxa]
MHSSPYQLLYDAAPIWISILQVMSGKVESFFHLHLSLGVSSSVSSSYRRTTPLIKSFIISHGPWLMWLCYYYCAIPQETINLKLLVMSDERGAGIIKLPETSDNRRPGTRIHLI